MDPTIETRKPYPLVIEERARDTPDRVYSIIPRTTDLQDGYRNLTYAEVAGAVDKLSWWLDEHLGKASNFETFAYMGANDHRYSFLYFAAMKTGRQVSITWTHFYAFLMSLDTTSTIFKLQRSTTQSYKANRLPGFARIT